MKKKVRRLAVLASGNGSTFQAVIKATAQNELDMEISLFISDNPKSFALVRAETARINTKVLTSTIARIRDEEMLKALKKAEIDIVLLAHYQQHIGPQVLSEYTVINSYPSLLPKYGGKSEMQVHEAVLQNNEKETGVTLYFAKDVFDQSHIIWQTHVPVYTEDCAKDVLERVCAAEKTQLVSILKAFSEVKIDIQD